MTEVGPAAGDEPAGSPLLIAHVSDLHLGAHCAASLDALVADVHAASPALTVVTGDCTMRARCEQFAQARAVLDRLPQPLLVVPGNHDVPLRFPARALRPYARYRSLLADDLRPVARIPGLCALGLTSMPNWRWKGGAVTERQAAVIREVMASAEPGDLRLLAVHHPPLPRGRERIVGRGRLLRALGAARVDLVLSGHTHLPTDRQLELGDAPRRHRTLLTVAGTATSLRTRGIDRSWTLIRVEPDAITLAEHHEVDPRAGAHAAWRVARTVRYPRGDAPGDDAPGDDAPGDDAPGDDAPGDDAPGDQARTTAGGTQRPSRAAGPGQ